MWKVIEEVGYLVRSLLGLKMGIFIGIGNMGYSLFLLNVDIEGLVVVNMSFFVGLNRVSYFLNIYGLSELIDIVCLSFLVVVYYVVCVIENGNCEMVIVGGVNIVVIL